MAILTTDQECFDFMKQALSAHGKACASAIEVDAAENPYDDQPWEQSVDAIRTNTVEKIGFGQDVMIEVSRKWLGYVGNESTKVDQQDMVWDLNYEMEVARDRVIANFSGKIP